MKALKFGKLNTLLGITLMMVIFILPISFTTFTFPTSASSVAHGEYNIEESEIAQLMYSKKIEKIDSFLNIHHQSINFQGNVLVAHNNYLIYNKSFGYSDPKNNTPLSDDHIFQVASITKQFTAMGIMILKERGLLDYSDSAHRYIDHFPYKDITIRQLLNHTSGLANYMWLLEHYWNKDRPPYNDDVMDMLARHRLNLYFKPGTRFHYTNTGYVVLASIIENITGMRYDAFMEENIFDPLDMNNSYVYSTAYGKNNHQHVNGYRQWGRYFRNVSPTVNDGTVGDKGVYSSVSDLYKWDQGLYENKLISEQTKKEAFQSLELKNGNHYPYGFGFRLKESNGKKMVYHYGKWNGFRTGIIRFIEDTSTIIILNHTDRPYNSRITRNIDQILHEKT
ncbi:MAG: serine hydrolase domain-containing protein [Bacteroidales bacterium]|nr:beta-lactamase family protein [Bacteroidales bacterium]